jgi:hypothetical protein
MLHRYRSSGEFGALSLLYIPSLLAAGVGLAWPYAELASRSRSGTLNAILAVVFMACIFGLLWLGMRVGKCRNQWLAAAVGCAVAVAAAVAVHLWMYAARTPTNASQSLLDFLQDRAARGWSFGKTRSKIPVKGDWAYACWALEGVLTIVAGMGAALMVTETPFCEECKVWADKQLPEVSIPGLPEDVIGSIQRATSVEEILAPSLRRLGVDQRRLCYGVQVCPTCRQMGVLEVQIKHTTTKLSGKTEESCTDVHTNVLLEPWHLEAIEELGQDVEAQLKVQKSDVAAVAESVSRTDIA